MTAERRRCAILGAGGYIGQHFARLLADHPWFDPAELVSSERSEGRRLEDVWLLSEPVPPSLAGVRLRRRGPAALAAASTELAFSALPPGVAGPFETALARKGIAVFSNASDHRLDPGVPLLVPEVNAPHLAVATRRARGTAPIVTNPNCSATGLALALAPILEILRPRTVVVSTYQALSGAGFPGVPSLAITDNVLPYIAAEEEKLARETGYLLGTIDAGRVRPADVRLVPQCARVGVREGHLESVTLEATRAPPERKLRDAWKRFDPLRALDLPTAPHPPIELRTAPDRPQPLKDRWAGAPARARGMAAVVGRVRFEAPFLRFFVLSHNAVRGGAGGSVLNAELAERTGALPKRGRAT